MKLFIYHENEMKEFNLVSSKDTHNELLQTSDQSINRDQVKVKKDVDKELYTMSDIVEIFQATRPTIYAWINKQILHPIRICGRVYFDPKDIRALVKQKRIVE